MARQILTGAITDKNRQWYIGVRYRQLTIHMTPGFFAPGEIPTASSFQLAEAMQELGRLQNLPPEILDEEATVFVQDHAVAWSLLPPEGLPLQPQ